MSTILLKDSTVPASFRYAVAEKVKFTNTKGIEVPVDVSLVYDEVTHQQTAVDPFGVFFVACANCVADAQFKEKKDKAIIFNNNDSNMIAALLINYDAEGEVYHYTFTFDPDDVSGVEKINYTDIILSDSNLDFLKSYDACYLRHHNVSILNYDVIKSFCLIILDTIRSYLDINAKDGEVVELVIQDTISMYQMNMTPDEYRATLIPVAIASVEIVKDVKRMAITFSEELKAIAKGNSDSNS